MKQAKTAPTAKAAATPASSIGAAPTVTTTTTYHQANKLNRRPGRNTTVRDRHRRTIRQGRHPNFPQPNPDCYRCHQPIDYNAPQYHDESYTVDHIIPMASARNAEERRQLDTLENKAPTHWKCNRDKGAKMPTRPKPQVTYVTERKW